MVIQQYYGYTLRGIARPLINDTYEGIGVVEKDGRVMGMSGPLGNFPTGQTARAAGVEWGKLWVEEYQGDTRKSG